jgi:TolB-like protein/tetratricopeptide (TPR) repeat protein
MDTAGLVGRTLGHHVVLGQIGAGGMGVVYRARDTRLDRMVALKVLPPGALADESRRRRLVQEARSASALNHPSIVTIYEIGTDDGIDFIAMEHVAGGTLADRLARGPLSPDEARCLAVQIVGALRAAHAAGIVHRDLKPSNVLLTPEGRAKLVDFGLAKLRAPEGSSADTAETLTARGTIVGTPAYLSPEQATGGIADARSDIFSFGCVLYEMLSGRRAFTGDSVVAVLTAVLRDTPAPVPAAPPGLQRVVERCLRKAPEERYQTAASLEEDLESSRAPLAGEPADSSIVVLPFANLGGSKDDDALCEGLAEEIINALTGIPGLRVIARTSAFAMGRQGLDLREVGLRLGVAHVLEGSVRRAGPRVRVTAQLVRARDSAHVWSERYDREMTDVFVLEDEISAAIAQRLRAGLSGESRLPSRAPVDGEAYHAYLEGRYLFARGGPADLGRAKARFEHAVARDPTFALAFDSLAEVYWFLGFFGAVPPRDAFSLGTWHVLRALELDETLAEAHALLGMLRKELDYNWAEVDRELRRALQLKAESPVVRLRYVLCGLMPHGRLEEAVAEMTRVLESDPLSLFARWWLACMLVLGRHTERAVEVARGMIDLDPTSFYGHWALGLALNDTDARDESTLAMQRACECSGGALVAVGFFGHCLGRAGRRDEALAALRRLQEAGDRGYVPPFSIALVHIGLGDWDAALEWMDRAIEARDPIIMPIKSFAFLDPIRQDPRFAALLRKMNLA